jgi:soluble lytic murein transglycosylase
MQVALAALAASGSACARGASSGPPGAGTTGAGDGAPAAAGDADADGRDASGTAAPTREGGASGELGEIAGGVLLYPDAIRAGRWDDAEASIAAQPPGERARPEVRYARARVAMARGAYTEALAALDKLEDDLPLVQRAVVRLRAEAMGHVGPWARAAELFAARTDASASVASAEAWKKAGDNARARAMCDRALADGNRTRALEEKARALRMPIVRDKDGDGAAANDARWLAVHAQDDANLRAASEVLEALGKPLTGGDHMERARALTALGMADEARTALDRAEQAGLAGAGSGSKAAIELCRARAEAYFRALLRNRYPEAALAYKQCAALGGPRAAEDMFLAGRAFSRADRDASAVTEWRALMTRFPSSPFAEQAEFHVARTHALSGRWRDAAQAFDAYKKHFPNGKERREADRYRAIAHLLARDHKVARTLLEELSGSAEDPLAQARWTNLAALAALRDGDRTFALGRWAEVARSKPLTWPALVARARLTQAQSPLPLTIDPSETGGGNGTGAEPLAFAELPTPAGLLQRVGLDGEADAALREREAIVTGRAGARGTEALCATYAVLDRGNRRLQLSNSLPPVMLKTAPGPRNRWAWDCTFPRPHRAAVREHASAEAPVEMIWGVMRQESAFDPDVVSPARAVGLMQLLPETARAVASASGIPHDDAMLVVPAHNVRLGALYLKELSGKLAGRDPLVLAAYNAGPEAITRWVSRTKAESIDVFVELIPFLETRGYVARVMGNVARYGFLERGEAGVPRLVLDLPALSALREPEPAPK